MLPPVLADRKVPKTQRERERESRRYDLRLGCCSAVFKCSMYYYSEYSLSIHLTVFTPLKYLKQRLQLRGILFDFLGKNPRSFSWINMFTNIHRLFSVAIDCEMKCHEMIKIVLNRCSSIVFRWRTTCFEIT